MQDISSVNIIGAGNVGSHLFEHLSSRVEEMTLFSRKEGKSLNDLPIADLNIICVKDDAIQKVAQQLNKNIPTVHTSGSVDLIVLDGFDHYGILYPLQTFTKNRAIDLSNTPFLIESNNSEFTRVLESFAKSHFSSKVLIADSALRSKIHLSAVFAANFTTYMLQISEDILGEIDAKILEPLVNEVVSKTFDLGAAKALTGPAVRGDQETINKHLNKLKLHPDYHKIYSMLTESIQKLKDEQD